MVSVAVCVALSTFCDSRFSFCSELKLYIVRRTLLNVIMEIEIILFLSHAVLHIHHDGLNQRKKKQTEIDSIVNLCCRDTLYCNFHRKSNANRVRIFLITIMIDVYWIRLSAYN